MATIKNLIGNEVASSTLPQTLVYKATHEGQSYLPFMERSFISFSYGGKNIEDFNLLAYTSGDRMEKLAYASFEDLTTVYDTVLGLFYWGTYFHANSLSFTLATDEMTLHELDDFKHWFRAGAIRELILAEHPNRAIMARIAAPPQMHLLGFKKEVTVPFELGDASVGEVVTVVNYDTYTTVYRGEIDIEFIMDEPFWYSIQNVLGHLNTLEGYYEESWIDANGQVVTVKDSPDALKIVYEDRIPLGSTTKIDVFLGGDIYASVKYEIWSCIPTEIIKEAYDAVKNDTAATPLLLSAYYSTLEYEEVINEQTGAITLQLVTKYWKGAVIYNEDSQIGGKISGAELLGFSAPVEGIFLPYGSSANLYYAGTAPAPVILRFGLVPQIRLLDVTGTGQAYYIITPKNSHSDDNTYNTITLTATNTYEFKFTLPTFWLSYNLVIEIFDDPNIIASGNAWLTVRETIRDTIRHPVIRAWANTLINKYDSTGGNGIIPASTASIRGDLEEGMYMLLCDNEGEPFNASFTFDGKTGLAIGKFTYRDVSKLNITSSGNLRTLIISVAGNGQNYTVSQEENVGDMVRSGYLILLERNVLDNNFLILKWTSQHPDYSYLITHDIANGLSDMHFEFKNMYL